MRFMRVTSIEETSRSHIRTMDGRYSVMVTASNDLTGDEIRFRADSPTAYVVGQQLAVRVDVAPSE